MDLMKSITQEYEKLKSLLLVWATQSRFTSKLKKETEKEFRCLALFSKDKTATSAKLSQSESFLRYRCGKDFPALTEDRKDRSRKKRRGKKSETELHA